MIFVDLLAWQNLWSDLLELAPVLILVITASFVLLIEALFPSDEALYTALLSLWGMTMSAVALLSQWNDPPVSAFGGMLQIDRFALFVDLLIIGIGGITIMVSTRFFKATRLPSAEYSFFVLTAMAGMMILSSAADLLVVFLGLELMSLSTYVLVGYQAGNRLANEGALKYLILGAFASAFFIYGIALMFAATGTTHLSEIAKMILVLQKTNVLFWLSLLFFLIGFGFKIAAVPFHMWVPDVYEGAPTPITGFMAAGVKVAAFAALLRFLFVGIIPAKGEWTEVLWWIAVLTMTVGNLAALRQSNMKRMLAYSSIAHAGYLLIALIAADSTNQGAALASSLYYFVAYSLMTLGAFAILTASAQKEGGEGGTSLVDYTGFGLRQPFLAAMLALFLLSLGGIPPTAGFMGKLLVFKSGLESGYVTLIVIAVLNSALSVYYYLRPVVYMYMRPGSSALETESSWLLRLGVVIPALGVVILGVAPGKWLEIAIASAKTLAETFNF